MLKKTFPVIVVLIALSVLGVIIIQASWLSNLILIQQERYSEKASAAVYDVKEALAQHLIGAASHGSVASKWLPPEMTSLLTQKAYVENHFTSAQIEKIIRKSLDDRKLKDVTFEFGITRPEDDALLVPVQSKNFVTASLDTIHNRNFSMAILPETLNPDAPSVTTDEMLWVTVNDFYATVRHSLIWMMIAAVAFTIIIIAAFFLTIKTIINQRNLSKIKNDFVNNMTHELKTPLATISLAVDALQNSKVISNPEKSIYFSDIIRQENKRMNKHVETILQAALMDKQDMKLNLTPLHAHEIIQKVINTFTLQLNQKGGTAELLLNAKNDLINADETHFTNLINNLIDNAVKYSKEDNLHITVTTHCTTKYLAIQVHDNGIGMSKETVKRIFEKFYRAHTGNVHNVKGFGLGMSYVKSVVDAHSGKIKVESVQGKGSTFTVDIPLYKGES